LETVVRRHAVWACVVLAYVIVFPYFERLNNPNENVRIWMTRAIVAHGTFAIDAVEREWGEVSDRATDGRQHFSGKAPGTSLLGVPVAFGHAQLGKLAGAPSNVREAVLATRELLPLVEARSVDLGRHRGDVLPVRAPAWLTAPTLAWLLGHFPPVRLLLEAHANPEELRAVCRDTLAEARRLGVAVPRLEAAEPYFLGEAATHLDPPPQDPARTETPQASRTHTPPQTGSPSRSAH